MINSFQYFKFFIIAGLLLVITTSAIIDKKPKVFVIGDSISIQYGPYLKDALQGFFEYDRKRDNGQALKDLDNPVGANGGDSTMVLEYLKKLQDSTDFKTDFLVINCGLHDIKTKPSSGKIQIPFENYVRNISDIIDISKKMHTKLIWINTTPVVDSTHNKKSGFHRFSSDVIKYNEGAKKLMKDNKIPIIDLFTFTNKFGANSFKDHVHYHEEFREKQADFIAGNLISISENY